MGAAGGPRPPVMPCQSHGGAQRYRDEATGNNRHVRRHRRHQLQWRQSDGAERSAEGQGGESGEFGTQYAISDTATEVRAGVRLIISYNSTQEAFSGTVENTTNATVTQVRVEIHLSNGVELGPMPRVDLAAGETKPVELDARGQTFTHYSVHVELGSSTA